MRDAAGDGVRPLSVIERSAENVKLVTSSVRVADISSVEDTERLLPGNVRVGDALSCVDSVTLDRESVTVWVTSALRDRPGSSCVSVGRVVRVAECDAVRCSDRVNDSDAEMERVLDMLRAGESVAEGSGVMLLVCDAEAVGRLSVSALLNDFVPDSECEREVLGVNERLGSELTEGVSVAVGGSAVAEPLPSAENETVFVA